MTSHASTILCAAIWGLIDNETKPASLAESQRRISLYSQWLLKGLTDGHGHPCSSCSIGRVIFGILSPWVEIIVPKYDLKLRNSNEGIIFILENNTETAQPVLAIRGFSTSCTTGDSQKLRVFLDVELWVTEGGASTRHKWESRIPSLGFMERRNPNKQAWLNREAQALVKNDIYHPVGREMLAELMRVLCVPNKEFKKKAREVSQFFDQYK